MRRRASVACQYQFFTTITTYRYLLFKEHIRSYDVLVRLAAHTLRHGAPFMHGRVLGVAVRETQHRPDLRNDASSANHAQFTRCRAEKGRRPAVESLGEIDEKRETRTNFPV